MFRQENESRFTAFKEEVKWKAWDYKERFRNRPLNLQEKAIIIEFGGMLGLIGGAIGAVNYLTGTAALTPHEIRNIAIGFVVGELIGTAGAIGAVIHNRH